MNSRSFASALILSACFGAIAPAQQADDIEIHIIGFEVSQDAEQQLRDMATAAGGRYYPAADAAALDNAFGQATGVGVSSSPALSAELEPNNSFGSANPILPQGAIRGAIDPARDRDHYTFTVQRKGRLDVRLDRSPADLQLRFRVLNSSWQEVARWGTPPREVALDRADTYWIELASADRDKSSTDPYHLNFTFHPADEHERNDTLGTATPIDCRDRIRASILPLRDEDFYRFEIPTRGGLRVRISEVAKELEIQFRVLDANRREILRWQNPLAAGGENEAVADLNEPGTYYLHLTEYQRDACSPEEYALELEYMPGDAHEPNESAGTAASIPLDSPVRATILPMADQDFYFVDVDHPGALEVSLTGVPPEIDLQFRGLDREFREELRWQRPMRAGADNAATFGLPHAGRWYLHVSDGDRDARSAQPYQLQVRYLRADHHEPNNHSGQAARIVLGQSVRGSILPQGDQDHFAFELAAPGKIEVAVTGVPTNLDIAFRILDHERREVQRWVRPMRAGAETRAEVELKAPGLYYLHLLDNGNDAFSGQEYALTVRSAGGPP